MRSATTTPSRIRGHPVLLLDTSALIRLNDLTLPPDEVVLSALSYAELAFGIEKATDAAQRRDRQAYRSWLEDILLTEWKPFDVRAADGYARLAARVVKARPAHARRTDIMIAGHAYALGAKLVTLNPKDFELVADAVEIVVPRIQ